MFSQTGFIINPNILVEKLVIEMSQKIAAGYLQFCSKTVEEMLENHVFFPPQSKFPSYEEVTQQKWALIL